jgi:hypothetical protein
MKKILFLILIMAAGYPVLKMQFDDYGYYEKVLEQLKELQILDSETNGLMMRSRLDIDKNYDRLSAIPGRINDIQTGISAELSSDNTSFASNFKEYTEAQENKSSIVENFKSHNSVLRNSVRYVPFATDRLIQVAQESRHPAEAETLKKLKADLLEYSLTGRGTAKNRISDQIPEITALKDKLPIESSILALSFLNHVDVIMREKEITDAYLEKAINARTGKSLSATADLLQSKIEVERGSFLKRILIIYFSAFSLLLLYQIATMRTSHKEPLPT